MAPVGYGAGPVSARRIGVGAGKAVGTFAALVARYGLKTKNVPTHIEIIAELLACHAGAVTNRRLRSGYRTTTALRSQPFCGPKRERCQAVIGDSLREVQPAGRPFEPGNDAALHRREFRCEAAHG